MKAANTIFTVARWIVDRIGATRDDLRAPWVRWLCAFNGILALQSYVGQFFEKSRFPTPSGERKVAAFNVMNGKYVGPLRWTLFAHIAAGMTAQLCSSLSIFLEDYNPRLARRLAQVASVAEAAVHAPTAFILSPFVYGDKGIIPYVYGTVSFLLLISGLTSVKESFSSNNESNGDGDSNEDDSPRVSIELRRMCTTISIFLYVRLYALMRSPSGFLRKQKYSMAVMTAGTAMMPVGWARGVFPAVFWCLMLLNRTTVGQTLRLIRKYGVDGAASRLEHLA